MAIKTEAEADKNLSQPTPSSSGTVLLIEDDASCCLYLEKALRHYGYNIVIAKNAQDGLSHFEKEPFDAVLLDIFLPDVDGVEIARRLRKLKGKNFPIIGLTCTPFDTLKEQFPNELINFTDICIKPFGYQSIIDILKKSNSNVAKGKNSFEHLIKDYQASIPDRLELLHSLMLELKKKPNEKSLKELRLQVHKTAGSAGLYGYDAVSKICKEFDELLGHEVERFSTAASLPANFSDVCEGYFEKIKNGFLKSDEVKAGELEQKIKNKTALIGVIGLGNIGLALLDAFGKAGFPLVGYDINNEKVNMLKNKQSYLNYMDMSSLFSLIENKTFNPSADASILKNADVLIISVPTSMDQYGTPNLSNLKAAFETVSANLKKQQLIILQSSTYPGTTREELLPLLLKSNLNIGIDFFLGHVPEIADVGNPDFSFTQMPRIVSGITPACIKKVSLLYEYVSAKVIPCSTTDVAESAKLLQNAFRLLNISFINEMKILFDKMNIDVWEVITAAATKPFGFMPFFPSPGIGGDCIPIAPFYLVWKAKATGGPTTLLDEAGRINNEIPDYVIGKLVEGLNLKKKTIRDSKILVLGVAYKKDVNDTRESVALKIIPKLRTLLADVSYHDPYVKTLTNFPDHHQLSMDSINFDYALLSSFDAVLVLTDHSFYDWANVVKNSNLVIDTRNISAKLVDLKKIIKA